MQISGIEFGRVGLGAMLLSTAGRPERSDARRALAVALDAGARHLDTADAYALDRRDTGHNERLIAEVLAARGDRDVILVATKGGHVRDDHGGWQLDGRPKHLRQACDASLRALQVERIDLYYLHRPDPAVPYADSVGTLAELRAEGKIASIGVSNIDLALVEVAAQETSIAAVQNELAPDALESLPVLRWCEQHDVPFMAWAPLGGSGRAADVAQRLPVFAEVAGEVAVSPAQVVLAWLMTRSPVLAPIPGFRRPASALDSLRAADLTFTGEQLRRLDASVDAAGASAIDPR